MHCQARMRARAVDPMHGGDASSLLVWPLLAFRGLPDSGRPKLLHGAVGGQWIAAACAATNFTQPYRLPPHLSVPPSQSAVLYLVGHASRAYMLSLNSTRVEGLEVVEQAMARPAGQPLITVSNHVAALDDPLVMAALLPPGALEQPQALRWVLACAWAGGRGSGGGRWAGAGCRLCWDLHA